MILTRLANFTEDAVKPLQNKPLLALAGFIFLYILHAVSYRLIIHPLIYPLSDFVVVSLCFPTVPCEACPRPLVGTGFENTSHTCHFQTKSVSICI